MTILRQNSIQSFAFVISACSALCFACCFASELLIVSFASPADKVQLENQINPNTAPVESLIRLPDIGLARAEAIIEYRETFIENDNGRLAFRVPDDLQNIKGIGPKTVQNMSQWLKFE